MADLRQLIEARLAEEPDATTLDFTSANITSLEGVGLLKDTQVKRLILAGNQIANLEHIGELADTLVEELDLSDNPFDKTAGDNACELLRKIPHFIEVEGLREKLSEGSQTTFDKMVDANIDLANIRR